MFRLKKEKNHVRNKSSCGTQYVPRDSLGNLMNIHSYDTRRVSDCVKKV